MKDKPRIENASRRPISGSQTLKKKNRKPKAKLPEKRRPHPDRPAKSFTWQERAEKFVQKITKLQFTEGKSRAIIKNAWEFGRGERPGFLSLERLRVNRRYIYGKKVQVHGRQ